MRIRESGLSSIEVVDNGSGIQRDDWPSIGLKHHTSKLPDLALLPTVQTFGFRGEALSALCALCEGVSVTTCTKETEPMGSVIKLGRDGRVVDDTAKVARPVSAAQVVRLVDRSMHRKFAHNSSEEPPSLSLVYSLPSRSDERNSNGMSNAN